MDLTEDQLCRLKPVHITRLPVQLSLKLFAPTSYFTQFVSISYVSRIIPPLLSNQHGIFLFFGLLLNQDMFLDMSNQLASAHCLNFFISQTFWPNVCPVQATQVYIQFSASAPFNSLLPLCVLRQLFISQSWPGTVVTKVLSSAGSN
jgi:hypothetical protein